ANRMKPSGPASRKKARSPAERSGPAQPRIAARGLLMAAPSLLGGRDDDAVGLAALQRAANALGLLLVERARLHTVPHALVAEIDLGRLHAEIAQHVAVRGLQARPGRLGDVLALDRSDLHAPAPL